MLPNLDLVCLLVDTALVAVVDGTVLVPMLVDAVDVDVVVVVIFDDAFPSTVAFWEVVGTVCWPLPSDDSVGPSLTSSSCRLARDGIGALILEEDEREDTLLVTVCVLPSGLRFVVGEDFTDRGAHAAMLVLHFAMIIFDSIERSNLTNSV